MYITWQALITAGSVLAALGAILAVVIKVFRWIDRQGQQDKELGQLKAKHDRDISALQEEQTLIVFGLLSCLKGLREKGCNGPVTAAIEKLEKHLNLKAHGQTEEVN